jgi:hypothetical protein
MHSEQTGFWHVLHRVFAGLSWWVKHIACLAITVPPTSVEQRIVWNRPGITYAEVISIPKTYVCHSVERRSVDAPGLVFTILVLMNDRAIKTTVQESGKLP